MPARLRRRACRAPERETGLRVAVDAGRGRTHAAVPVCAFRAPAATPDVAAVAWTAGAAGYVDRAKTRKAMADLEPWLAAHWAFGVRFFLIFESGATWADAKDSALWPAVEPLARAGRARLLPWPQRACGADGEGPWVTLDAGEHDALSLQSFWGASSRGLARKEGRVRRSAGAVPLPEFFVPSLAWT